MVQPTSVVDRRQAWGDGGSPYTSSIIVLTCISGLEPDLVKRNERWIGQRVPFAGGSDPSKSYSRMYFPQFRRYTDQVIVGCRHR